MAAQMPKHTNSQLSEGMRKALGLMNQPYLPGHMIPGHAQWWKTGFSEK